MSQFKFGGYSDSLLNDLIVQATNELDIRAEARASAEREAKEIKPGRIVRLNGDGNNYRLVLSIHDLENAIQNYSTRPDRVILTDGKIVFIGARKDYRVAPDMDLKFVEVE